MRTNNYCLQILLMAWSIVITLPVSATPTLKIISLEPLNKSIMIGSHYYNCKDTLKEEDFGKHIHWDKNLKNQAVLLWCIGSAIDCPEQSVVYTKNTDIMNGKPDGSLVGLFAKGTIKRPVILWRDSLIAVDQIVAKDGFEYYCSIPNNTRTPKLVKKDGKLYLKSNDFRDFGTEIKLEIFSLREEDGDKQTLMFLDVEQVK